MTRKPAVSFVIPVKNDAERLDRCLTSVRRASRNHPVELLVIDNGSSDDSRSVAIRHGAEVFCAPDARVGQLRNMGAQAAASGILAFVDADHELGERWTEAAIDALAGPQVAAAGARYESPPWGTWTQRMYGALRGRTIGQADAEWLGAGNLAVRTSVFRDLGGFDSSLEACEDVDFCFRLRQAGWRLVEDERLRSVHLGDPPTLRKLFVSELWRGRDNLRVSLRGPLTLRALVSVVLPIIELGCLTGGFVALLAFPFWGFAPAYACAACLLGAPLLRAVRMVRFGSPRPRWFVQAYAVALTYDLARALALVARAPHHRAARV